MDMFKKSIIDVMVESAKVEDFELNDLFDDETEKEFNAAIDSIGELQESLIFTPDMVPVIKHENNFYIDLGDIYRIMECSDEECEDDEFDVVSSVISANDDEGMTLENTFIVVESKEHMMKIVSEAKAAVKSKSGIGKKNGKAKLTAAADVFKNMKNKGLKLIKKKGKKKKKK
ncbi:MAG: hypothetical protein M0P49_05820 [Bacilli bacterium]|nr:hypothetical protein [Bacilli bacterium]